MALVLTAIREPAAMSTPSDPASQEANLLLANLERVFSERDGARRRAAIEALYDEDATLFEPNGVVTGRAAIDRTVEALLASLPPDFAFTPAGAAQAHHEVGQLRWTAGPRGGPVALTGVDVARFVDGRIQTLHVFLDPTDA